MRNRVSRIKKEGTEPLSEAELWPKLLRYCAYQERAPAEVVQKMRLLGLEDQALQERLLARLQAENYLSATRYAEAYTRGKLRNNRWGQRKIALGLAAKGVDKALIADQLHALPPDDVRATLRTLLERRDASTYHALPALERRQKLYRLGLSRGFEADMVGEEVKRVMGK